ncbi:MAG TPA: hypothetical protein VI795_03215 [Patescibacteria group bacterium]|nr:hypothetical protein [Patescibacteria group bacterium]
MRNISEKVSVTLDSDTPLSVTWKNRDYKITKIGLRHNYYEGKTLVHIFSVLSNNLFMKLKFDTKHLSWKLLEFSENGI